jgi:hypothetical protein
VRVYSNTEASEFQEAQGRRKNSEPGAPLLPSSMPAPIPIVGCPLTPLPLTRASDVLSPSRSRREIASFWTWGRRACRQWSSLVPPSLPPPLSPLPPSPQPRMLPLRRQPQPARQSHLLHASQMRL